jgi:polyphosphate kinase
VETIVRVTDRGHAQELRRLLELGMSDETASWWLDADGTWTRRDRGPHGERLRDIQAMLIGDRRLRAADG